MHQAEREQAVELLSRAAPAAAPGLATAPAPARLSPARLLALQRTVGNAAVGRALSAARARALQRDCGGDCGCAECSGRTAAGPTTLDPGADAEELKTGGSVRKGDRCDPARTIEGIVFVPAREEEIAVAKKAVDGSTKALATQNITLDLQVKPYLEIGDLSIADEHDNRTVSSYTTVCALLHQLEPMRSKSGVVVLVVPISGEVCSGHGMACYVGNLGDKCGGLSSIKKVIILGRFMAEDQIAQVLAHELGHHAGAPQRNDPTTWGHEFNDRRNYMGVDKDRDHYRSELLDRMCKVSFQF